MSIQSPRGTIMAIKETDNTTKYTNLAIEDPKGTQEIIQFLSGITDDRLEFSEAKKLIGLIRDTFSPLNIARSAVQNIIAPV